MYLSIYLYSCLQLISLVTLNALNAGFGKFSPQGGVMQCIVGERRIIANRCKIVPTFSYYIQFFYTQQQTKNTVDNSLNVYYQHVNCKKKKKILYTA